MLRLLTRQCRNPNEQAPPLSRLSCTLPHTHLPTRPPTRTRRVHTLNAAHAQSVHVDLDHDEVTWPPLPAAIAASPTEPKKGQEGETPGSPGFGSEGEGAGATGGAGEAEGGGGVGPPPVWPEEAARRARRVVQSIMFPEFDSFDVVRLEVLRLEA